MLKFVTAGAACAALLLGTAAPAMAVPPVGTDPLPPVPTVTVTPTNRPVVAVDLARQTTNRAAVRITGSARDADLPAAALTVQVRIDGTLVKTLVANLPDPLVKDPGFAKALPPVGVPGHRFDTTVNAGASPQQVCVTALNIGPAGANTTLCKPIDRVLEFRAHSISYDTAHTQITATALESLEKVTHTNATNVQQSTSISGSKTVTDTQGWSDSVGVKVTVSGGVGIPLLADGKVTVEGSANFTQNGQTSNSRTFSWQQPVLVPAHSKVVATVAVTKSTLVVPYALSGNFLYTSGFLAPGSTSGSYAGVNAHDLEVRLDQFNLDGTPAAKPAPQPSATLLRIQ